MAHGMAGSELREGPERRRARSEGRRHGDWLGMREMGKFGGEGEMVIRAAHVADFVLRDYFG
jgi:hypothetical protein